MITRGAVDAISYAWILVAVIICIVLLKVPAPYGRHVRKGWGPFLHARTVWIVMELPAPVVMLLCYVFFLREVTGKVGWLFLLLWEIHYVYRTFIYPLRLGGNSRHMALSIVVISFIFNVINGLLNGYYIFYLNASWYSPAWLFSFPFLFGFALFWIGFLVNIGSDEILRQIKMSSGTYGVPKGFLYRYVSCPNYLGEIVEWIGWAILTWSVGGFAFAVWTAANLCSATITFPLERQLEFPVSGAGGGSPSDN